ncbi:MAG: hypothetical protein R3B09_23845 [Nannocystaceae bacterium]
MEIAAEREEIDPDKETLKIFVAPEFYFRPEVGGAARSYPKKEKEYLTEALGALRDEQFEGWLYVFGTVVWEEQLSIGTAVWNTALTRLLRGAFPDISPTDVAGILKGLGKGALEIANRLVDEFAKSGIEVAKILKAVSFSAADVARALDKALSWGADAVAGALKWSEYACQDVGDALYSYFASSSEDAGKLLANVGYSATDIAKTLKAGALWNKSCRATGDILKKAGFGKTTISDALKAAGWSASVVNDVIHDLF